MYYVRVYKIPKVYLPAATKAMNYESDGFSSRVLDVESIDKDHSLVTVKIDGYYPYITDKWRIFYKEEEGGT